MRLLASCCASIWSSHRTSEYYYADHGSECGDRAERAFGVEKPGGRAPRPCVTAGVACSTGRSATARTACAGGLVIKHAAFFGLADADRYGSSVSLWHARFGGKACTLGAPCEPACLAGPAARRGGGRYVWTASRRRWKRTAPRLSFFLDSVIFTKLSPTERSATLALSRETTDGSRREKPRALGEMLAMIKERLANLSAPTDVAVMPLLRRSSACAPPRMLETVHEKSTEHRMIAHQWQELQNQPTPATAHWFPNKRAKVAPPGSTPEATVSTISGSAEAELFVSECLDTQKALENMTAEEAIEIVMASLLPPCAWPQAQLQLTAPTDPRARAEGLTLAQICEELEAQVPASVPAPAANKAQLQEAQQHREQALQEQSVGMIWATRVLPIGMPVGVPMPLLPPLFPFRQRRSYPAAPPPALPAPSRVPELLTAAAAHRTFVEHCLRDR